MINATHRKTIYRAMEETGLTRQAWLASILRDADAGDEISQEKVKLFCRVYRKTGSSKHAEAAVTLAFDQLSLLEDQ